MPVATPLRWISRLTRIGIVTVLLAAAGTIFAAPTIAAAACPSCYGMQPLGKDRLFVDVAMPEGTRRDLQESMSAAEMAVAAFFGAVSPRRVVLACSDEDCEARLKGRLEGTARVRAFAYDAGGYPVIRLSPRGLSRTIIAHELTHVEVHERIGFLGHMLGIFPAWFDEGLAVLVSDDRRYFRTGKTAPERCVPTPGGELPSKPLAWDDMAGKSPWIYAKAACDVMRWMEANGGEKAVLAAIADAASGKRFVP
jgi:hypothetical protein